MLGAKHMFHPHPRFRFDPVRGLLFFSQRMTPRTLFMDVTFEAVLRQRLLAFLGTVGAVGIGRTLLALDVYRLIQ